MFRTENLSANINQILRLFSFKKSNLSELLLLFKPKVLLCVIASLLICVIGTKTDRFKGILGEFTVICIFIISVLQISASGFSPFLYFRF